VEGGSGAGGQGGRGPGEKGLGGVREGGEEGWEVGFPRWWKAGEKGKIMQHCIIFCKSKKKKCKEAGANKYRTEPRLKGMGRVSSPLK